MKLTFTDLNDMIRELKEKSVQSIRVNEVIRDVQVMIPDEYPMPIKTFSVYVTASTDGEWNEDLVAEYVEHVGCVDELAGRRSCRTCTGARGTRWRSSGNCWRANS